MVNEAVLLIARRQRELVPCARCMGSHYAGNEDYCVMVSGRTRLREDSAVEEANALTLGTWHRG